MPKPRRTPAAIATRILEALKAEVPPGDDITHLDFNRALRELANASRREALDLSPAAALRVAWAALDAIGIEGINLHATAARDQLRRALRKAGIVIYEPEIDDEEDPANA